MTTNLMYMTQSFEALPFLVYFIKRNSA